MRKAIFILLTFAMPSISCRMFQIAIPVAPTPTLVFHEVSKIIIPGATMIYYAISGATADELRTQMDQKGVLDPADGLRYDARTDWHITWTWSGYGSDECDLSQVSVTYDIKVTVPSWKPEPNVNPLLVDRWNIYMHNLAVHEQTHVDNIINIIPQVSNAIRNATCTTAEQSAQDVLTALRKLNMEYDRKTDHGKTQGAVFP